MNTLTWLTAALLLALAAVPLLPRRRRFRIVIGAAGITVLGAALAIGAIGDRPAAAATMPTIQSDAADYNPGQTVTLTGGGWAVGSSPVHVVVEDSLGKVWSHVADVTPNGAGQITDAFALPSIYVADYSVIATQATLLGELRATSSFTDANPSANLDQCANGTVPANAINGCSSDAADWVNGNLGSSKATYYEGDSIPYRMTFGSLSLTSHTVSIEWDTTKGGKHAIDYLTTYNRTVTNANPCLGISGCPATPGTFPIPADPQVTGAGVAQLAGAFKLFGGSITSVGVSPYYAGGAGFPAGDNSRRITITFTATQDNPVLAWGGHISNRSDWGENASAVAIAGSPYHMRLIDLDGSGGNQDRSLSADAVIFPGSITIIKDATPNGSTSFPFTASPAPLANFSLVDDGTAANTKVFPGIVDFTTYSVAEAVPAGWDLTGVDCAVAGGTSTTPPSTTTNTVAIALKEGDNVTCTYANASKPVPQLHLRKVVVNDNGGTATTQDFTLTANGTGSNDLSGVSPVDSGAGLLPDTWTLSETTMPGYTASAWVCIGGGTQNGSTITLGYSQSATCTITNDDVAPKLHLHKVVVNDNGGTATVANFTLTANGTGANDLSGTSPVDSGATLKADTFALSESSRAGYAASGWVCVGGSQSGSSITVGIGGEATCTITNDDIAPKLHLRKLVVNDNGGTALASAFTLTADGAGANDVSGVTPVDSGSTLQAGTWALSESSLAGYAASAWVCTGGSQSGASITVGLGGEATCTITNDDVAPKLHLRKVVVNDNGGTATVGSFTLTANGTGANDLSGTSPVDS
ncbi:MAG: prealbumin-like fold domain-containing protein, partial [Gaiellales bacterium]